MSGATAPRSLATATGLALRIGSPRIPCWLGGCSSHFPVGLDAPLFLGEDAHLGAVIGCRGALRDNNEIITASVRPVGCAGALGVGNGGDVLRAGGLQVGYDAGGVRLAEDDLSVPQHLRRRLPRAVDVLGRQPRELRHPLARVGAVRVLRVGQRVHHKVPLINARFSRILPHHAVNREVGVHQRVMEPLRARPPMDVEVLRQE
mmetsp:Transcript_40087/g.101444  ORF Transcript_40087/g.101444 Transcript_40087/m.101444 type:complete len:204 (-) Transcript_40087:52-663(-)